MVPHASNDTLFTRSTVRTTPLIFSLFDTVSFGELLAFIQSFASNPLGLWPTTCLHRRSPCDFGAGRNRYTTALVGSGEDAILCLGLVYVSLNSRPGPIGLVSDVPTEQGNYTMSYFDGSCQGASGETVSVQISSW